MKTGVALASRKKTAPTAPSRSPLGSKKFPFDRMVTQLGKRDSRSARAAFFLNWAADEFPKAYMPWNAILQNIQGRQGLPRMSSDEVAALRGSCGLVRRALQKQHKRDLVIAGAAARATTDDEDTAAVALPRKMKSLRSAKNAVMATHALIDPTQVRDPRIKAYLNRSVKEIMRVIGSAEFDKKLLPPADQEADSEDKESKKR